MGQTTLTPEELAQAAVALNVPQAEAAKMLNPKSDSLSTATSGL
jgi:hypothetical protein